VKPAAFTYHDPRTVADAAALLGRLENTKLLAGGQSLGPMLNFRFVMPDHVIDLNRVDGLAGIDVTDTSVEIGAMTRQRTLERSPEIRRALPVMAEALRHVGHFQTRNRGTLGGSLCHLDPAAELPGVCALYDAHLTVSGARGERTIPIGNWAQGYMTPDVAADELLSRVTLTRWREPHGYAFLEFARRHGDFAIAGVGCLLALDGGARVTRAAIVLIGVASAPLRLAAAERLLVGQPVDDFAIAAAQAEIAPLDAIDDAHVSGAYRKRIAGVLLGRAVRAAAANAREGHPA